MWLEVLVQVLEPGQLQECLGGLAQEGQEPVVVLGPVVGQGLADLQSRSVCWSLNGNHQRRIRH
jgi:hypothetical protein